MDLKKAQEMIVMVAVADAALLREHGLIDYLGRATKHGREVAEGSTEEGS